jgi:hypothetical protein
MTAAPLTPRPGGTASVHPRRAFRKSDMAERFAPHCFRFRNKYPPFIPGFST